VQRVELGSRHIHMLLRISVLLMLSAANALQPMTRRAAFLGAAASLGIRVSPLKPAVAAELNSEDPAAFNTDGIISRANQRKLNVQYVIERARANKLFATSRSDYYNECTVLDQLQEVDKLALESEQRLVQKLRRDQLNAKPEDFNRITKELEDEKIVLTRLVRQVVRIMSKEEADACLIDRYVQ